MFFLKFLPSFRVTAHRYLYIQYIVEEFCHIVPNVQFVNPNLFSLHYTRSLAYKTKLKYVGL